MRSQSENNKITNTIETTLKNLSNIIDVNTVVGKPIKTDDGEYVVPISKVTVGVLVGGGEYGKVNVFSKNDTLPFSAGNGAIVSVKPCAFLVKDNDKYKIMSIADSPIEKIIDKASDFISQVNQGDTIQWKKFCVF